MPSLLNLIMLNSLTLALFTHGVAHYFVRSKILAHAMLNLLIAVLRFLLLEAVLSEVGGQGCECGGVELLIRGVHYYKSDQRHRVAHWLRFVDLRPVNHTTQELRMR